MNRILLILFFAIFISCTSNNNQPAINKEADFDNPNGPKLHFYSEKLDLGTIKEGEKIDFKYRLKNTGKSDLLITGVHAGCGCTSTNWETKPIKPGEESEIKIVFNSTGKSGVVNKRVDVSSNAQKEDIVLRFTCQIVSPNKSR